MKNVWVLFLLIGISGIATGVHADMKPIFGWVERARISPAHVVLSAKLDTGADHSSLNVGHVTAFQRDGEDWVRFEVTSDEGKTETLERKLVRTAKIKRHSGPRQERPVVRLGICIGNFYGETEVNLVDRSRFKYQLLIGRSFMQDKLLVDPSRQYTSEPQCTDVGSTLE
jgi:hypothetical protein